MADGLHSEHGTLLSQEEVLGAVGVSKYSDNSVFSGESYQELPMRTELPFYV